MNMTFTKLIAILLLAYSVEGKIKLRRNQPSYRRAKSLENTFPFNAKNEAKVIEKFHDGHNRNTRQGDNEAAVGFEAVAAAEPGDDGKKCIDKVEMVEETEYDDVVQCDHSYDKRCHTTYVTNYEAQQEEECEENFR